MIPYGRQDISQDDIDAVIRVLGSDFLTQGPEVPAFEAQVAAFCGVKHAVAANSATSALHIACLALGVGPGDVVWTSPITFVASANCALYCGASVDFVDIDSSTYNLSLDKLRAKLESSAIAGKLPKVLVAVHLSGQSCEMEEIKKLSNIYGFRVIEDASHAVGAKYKGRPVGSCEYSDITIFSFHPVKIITTAEGGMSLTNDPALARRMELLRSHGITRDSSEMANSPHGSWYYEQIDLGFNYRMTEIHAALGISQLKRIADFVERRRQIAETYDAELSGLPIVLPFQHPDTWSSYHLYVIRLLDMGKGIEHRSVFEALRAAGIGANLHYIPVFLQPYYQELGFKADEFPNSMAYYSSAITLPIYPGLTRQDQRYVVEELRRILLGR